MYRSLKADLIVQTCRSIQERVAGQFSGSGLSKVAGELLTVSEQAAELSSWLARPQIALRALAGVGIAAIVLIVAGVVRSIDVQLTSSSVADFLQGLDAAVNEMVFIGVAVFFFLTLETRLKRRRALNAIHELRSIAHIIDMHQITKDPDRLTAGSRTGDATAKRPRNPGELIRYLDNCSDMLAIISKIAALYVQRFNDPVTLSAVNDVESLTTGLSRKIWQKIMIFDRILAPANHSAVSDPVLSTTSSSRLPSSL